MLRPNTVGCPKREHGLYLPAKSYLPRPHAMERERARRCYFERKHESPEARAAASRQQEQGKPNSMLKVLLGLSKKAEVAAAPTLEQRFRQLSDDWARSTAHVSSGTDLVSHPSYRAIIDLGWPVVPLLLQDLKNKKGFWFSALAEITRLRPFDRSDEGNARRMSEAWLAWGQRKGRDLGWPDFHT